MKEKKYSGAEVEVLCFDQEDILTTSTNGDTGNMEGGGNGWDMLLAGKDISWDQTEQNP